MILTNAFFELSTSFFIGLFIGAGILFIYQFMLNKKQIKNAEKEANRVISKAKIESQRIEKKAELKSKDWQIKKRKELEREIRKEREKLQLENEKLQLRKSTQNEEYERILENYKEKKKELENEYKNLQQKKENLKHLEEEQQKISKQTSLHLEKIAQMTKEEAQTELENSIEKNIRANLVSKFKEIEGKLQKESEAKSKHLLAVSMAKHAAAVTSELTTTTVPVSGEDAKGKIIGREGRNIRALENSCGVDILIEEGQNSIVISCFDPVRREVAKKTIIRLIKDGRVHPARIEEVVEKVKGEINLSIKEEGEKSCFELNIHDVHSEIIKTLGGLKYRIINGQNALKMSVDLALLAGSIMVEIGGDERKARRASLFHGLGLNIDHTVEGSYSEVGANFARKYREKEDIIQAILCHNSQIPARSLLDHVTQMAFNLYQFLPGTKKSNIESFIQRMKDLESIANSFTGVVRSFAIRSGKELRVLVDSSQVTDDQTFMLCSDIARKLERETNQSQQIKVSVIRESRIIEHAR